MKNRELISRSKSNVIGALSVTIILLVVGFVFFLLVGRSLDRSIDNQNVMLCRSAKVSGNSEYLKKCDLFYVTGEIKYLRSVK